MKPENRSDQAVSIISIHLRFLARATKSRHNLPIAVKNGIAVSQCAEMMEPRHYLALFEFGEDYPTGWENMPPLNRLNSQRICFVGNPRRELHVVK